MSEFAGGWWNGIIPAQFQPYGGQSVPQPDQTTACARLKAADDAYNSLVLGNSVASITDSNGERLQYANTPGQMSALLDYMKTLQPLCSSYAAVSLGRPTGLPRPLKAIF